MSELSIELVDGRTQYEPRDEIRGTARWRLDEASAPPEGLEVRLFWYTQGKGDRDIGGVETERVSSPTAQGSHDFVFRAPRAPYSFSGTLVSLTWAIELVVTPDGDAARQEIVISSTGREIRLTPEDGVESSNPSEYS